jgi:hypothetical protein
VTYDFEGRASAMAPEYLRKALTDYLETGEVELTSYPAYLATLEGTGARVRWLTEQLWDCTDLLPPMYCEDLGLHHRGTYGEAARYLRSKLDLRTSRRAASSS